MVRATIAGFLRIFASLELGVDDGEAVGVTATDVMMVEKPDDIGIVEVVAFVVLGTVDAVGTALDVFVDPGVPLPPAAPGCVPAAIPIPGKTLGLEPCKSS